MGPFNNSCTKEFNLSIIIGLVILPLLKSELVAYTNLGTIHARKSNIKLFANPITDIYELLPPAAHKNPIIHAYPVDAPRPHG